MTYYANFNANHGTRLIEPMTDTNKRRILATIREVAQGNRFDGNTATFEVWHYDGDTRRLVTDYAATIDNHGTHYIVRDAVQL